ncbi:unnamed protein product [Bemisia tabaci]|uniref:Major facilitator superfamily (MFS) profile domain-containing protein n=1 Tax=Bemisia tabaci TaxID=7038 RepID=A0A9P0A048_BEMTA|nr:unnamed protein product [Bemisia tabaci]
MAKNEDEPPTGGFLRPFLIMTALAPIQLVVGSVLGQSAGMIPQLMQEDSVIKIDIDVATWIASMSTVGTFVAASSSGFFADKFGRIRMVQVAYFFLAVGYGIIGAANTFFLLIFGRFLIGFGVGCSFPASVYISEIAPPAYRGLLLTTNPAIASLGLVYMYVLGGYYPWNIASLATGLMSILGLIIAFFFYDSPVWLLRKNRIEDARKSLSRIEGPTNVDFKLKQLQEIVDSHPVSKFSPHVFIEPTVWKPYVITIILSILQNTAGFYIVVSYTVNFMREFHSTYDPLQIMVAIGLVRLVAICLSSAILRHVGRKTIGAFSGFAAAACLLPIYGCLVAPHAAVLQTYPWIPIALFLGYIFTMTLGIFALPWTMPYEMFPIKVRGFMCGVSFCSMYALIFVAVKLYNFLLENLQLPGMILMFAVGSLLFGVFSATVLVETHKKTLDEIEEVFLGRRSKQVEKTPGDS